LKERSRTWNGRSPGRAQETPAPCLAHGHLHGEPDHSARVGELEVSLRRYSADTSTARHAHERALLCLVVDGGCRERAHGWERDLARGDLFFCPAGEAHHQRFPDASRFLIVELAGPSARLADAGWGPRLLEDPAARAEAWRLVPELEQPDDLTPLAVESVLLDLTVRLLRRSGTATRPRRPAWIDDVNEVLRRRITRAPSLGELAAVAGLHPASLARAFRRHEGVSIGERLRELRVVEAARLLASTRRPLADVAAAAGFADQSHLTRVFRRATGETPGSYRRRRG